MNQICSYPKVYAVGHPAIDGIFSGPVILEEKVDGSQFSFMRSGESVVFRSKGAQVFPEDCPKLFKPAVDTGELNA